MFRQTLRIRARGELSARRTTVIAGLTRPRVPHRRRPDGVPGARRDNRARSACDMKLIRSARLNPPHPGASCGHEAGRTAA
jgi:hypothetical protein